ncbi:MAG: PAS domain S-box protein [Geobacter sp.]|nr:MAG: PAS domain S-box protein [Geobacter sp.]
MRGAIKKSQQREIHKIVGVYALFGSAWIYLSGYALIWLVTDRHIADKIEVYKGLLFILVTSFLLYQLIGRFTGRLAESMTKLEQSEARFQAIYHNVNDALFIHDAATSALVDVNRTMCDMFGYTQEEALNLTLQQLSLGERPYSEEEAQRLLKLAARGTAQTFEWRSRKKDGSLFWSEVSLRRAEIGGIDRIIVLVRDITARKEIEEALRQNEETLKVLMEEMPAGVAWANEAGVIEYVNGYVSDWLGFVSADRPTLEDLMQRALPDPSYRDEILGSWRAGIGEPLESGVIAPIEAKITCIDGTLRHVILNTRLVYHRILFTFTDITKWEAMQSEILKAQKLESLGVLAGGIAHDFNNILTGILGNLSFAELMLEGNHPALAPVKNAEKASQRAAELAHQLLTFSKGGQPIKKVVSVVKLVQESLSLALHGTKVQTKVDLPPDLHAIEADEGQINQAFSNVIINACQAMPGGGVLSVQAENIPLPEENPMMLPAGEYVKVSFTDEGCGIPYQEQKQIFDPYYSTKPGGSGLGLASVHSIVSRHGGKVEVDSAPGEGTTLTFYLPSAGEAAPEQEAQAEPASPRGGGGGSVLVMDDEEPIRTLAQEMLQYLGYRVTTCGTGEEAVRLYREAFEGGEVFAAAIMDLTIPAGMGGKEAAQRILELDPKAKLIVSSGYSNDPVMASYTEYGFCAAVVKPYRCSDLQQTLEKVACRR